MFTLVTHSFMHNCICTVLLLTWLFCSLAIRPLWPQSWSLNLIVIVIVMSIATLYFVKYLALFWLRRPRCFSPSCISRTDRTDRLRLTVVHEINTLGAAVNHSVDEQQVQNGHGYDDGHYHPDELQQHRQHHHLQNMTSSWKPEVGLHIVSHCRAMAIQMVWMRCTVVERRFLTAELFLFHAGPVADGWPHMWVSRPL